MNYIKKMNADINISKANEITNKKLDERLNNVDETIEDMNNAIEASEERSKEENKKLE